MCSTAPKLGFSVVIPTAPCLSFVLETNNASTSEGLLNDCCLNTFHKDDVNNILNPKIIVKILSALLNLIIARGLAFALI